MNALEHLGTQSSQAATQQNQIAVISPGERALATEVDRQVATAKAYPRNVALSLRRAQDMATVTPEVAASCYYSLRRKGRGGKPSIIEGPSIRVAEIIMSTWGNIRAQAQVIEEQERHIVARGVAWDMESNVAASVDVRRNIWSKRGRYSEDMIAVTAQAATSIALRNALLRVVPRVYVDQLVAKAKEVAAGDAKSLAARWQACVKTFVAMGVTEDDLYSYLQIEGHEQVTTAHLEGLLGLHTALKDGEITIEDAFGGAPEPRKKERGEGEDKPSQADELKAKLREQQAAEPEPEPPADEPQVGTEWGAEWAGVVEQYGAKKREASTALKHANVTGAPSSKTEMDEAVNALERILGV